MWKNFESYKFLKGKENNVKVILKLSKRNDTDKIKSNKKNNDDQKTGLPSSTKLLISESRCGYDKVLGLKCKKPYLEKKIASFCVTNGTIKISY